MLILKLYRERKLHNRSKFLKKAPIQVKLVIDRYNDKVIVFLSAISVEICWIPTIQTADNQKIKCEASFNYNSSMLFAIY